MMASMVSLAPTRAGHPSQEEVLNGAQSWGYKLTMLQRGRRGGVSQNSFILLWFPIQVIMRWIHPLKRKWSLSGCFATLSAINKLWKPRHIMRISESQLRGRTASGQVVGHSYLDRLNDVQVKVSITRKYDKNSFIYIYIVISHNSSCSDLIAQKVEKLFTNLLI